MARLTYVNERGQSLTFGDSAPLLVTKIEGLGSVQNRIQKQQAPYQDGSTVTGKTLSERELVIEGVILAKDKEVYRRQLLRVFNPKLTGTLRYERGTVVKEISCVPELAPAFPSNMQQPHQLFLITLLCPTPFWLDTFTESEEMADWIGGLAFPLQLPMMFAGRSTRVNTVLHNAGDVETPLTFEFIGPCTNPKVINADTGEFIKINKELAEYEKLIITTDFGRKRVRLLNIYTGEESNAFNYIDLDSIFFQLQPGDNQLSYDADLGKESAKVWIRWRNRYLGV
jgi:hypothetical protein